jgi:Domain of unknown function (DUF222)
VPADTQHPLPGDGCPGGPGHPAPSAPGHSAPDAARHSVPLAAVPVPGTPEHPVADAPGHPPPGTPGHPAPDAPAHPVPGASGNPLPSSPADPVPGHPVSLATTPATDAQDLDEILDQELEAPLRGDDPYRSYCEESEPRDEDEWPEESYLLAAPGSPRPEDFAVGGTADAMAPGPALAILADRVQQEGLEQLNDDQLTGVLQAANRLASWAASQKLAATSWLAARREADGQKSGDWRPFDHVDDEVAVALTLTRRSAGRLLDLALSLDRLPRTRAALAGGLIDERRAEVITEELAGLDDAHAAAAEKLIIAKAPALTTGQLRALARRLVISADPAAARRRKEQALRDARVETFTEQAGTAALAGRDLCPVDVLAADKHLTALAQAMKAAGISGTTDTLRAHAYLHLLSGHPASTLLPHPAPGAMSPDGTVPPSTSPGPAGPPPQPDPGTPASPGDGPRTAALPVTALQAPGPQAAPGRRTGSAASPSPRCKRGTAPTPANHAATSPAAPSATSSRSATPPAPHPAAAAPPARCDLDHVTPYHRGGRTCECNLGPASKS